jgi:hypothetical protein
MNKTFELLLNEFDKLDSGIADQQLSGADVFYKRAKSLTVAELYSVFNSYSAPAVQTIAGSRGLIERKIKQDSVEYLARHFYDKARITHLVNNLTPIGRDGLRRIKEAGGIVMFTSWRHQMLKKHGEKGFENGLVELTSNALAFFANTDGYNINLTTQFTHDLKTTGANVNNSLIWSFPQALDLLPDNFPDILNVRASSTAPAKPPQSGGFDNLIADLIAVTRYFEQTKVKLNRSGEPGKRDLTKLAALCSYKPANEEVHLTRVRLLFLLLQTTGILKIVEQNYGDEFVEVAPAHSEEFFELPRYRQARLLAAAWLHADSEDFTNIPTLRFYTSSVHYSDIPDSSNQRLARRYVMALIKRFLKEGSLKAGDWYDFNSLVAVIEDREPEILVPRRFKDKNSYDSSPYSYSMGYYGLENYNGFSSKLNEKDSADDSKTSVYYYTSQKKALRLDRDFLMVEGEWLAHILNQTLGWLGLFELAYDNNNRPVAFRLTELGKAAFENKPSETEVQQAAQLKAVPAEYQKALLVQPNFDLMIFAPLQNAPLLRQVDRFAEQVSMGDVGMYRLTKDSVLRGLRSGLRGDEVLDILDQNSRVPVAQNLSQTIREWANEFERLTLHEKTTILEIPAPLLDKMLEHPNAKSFIVRRLAPNYAIVKNDEARLTKLLQLSGWNTNISVPLYDARQILQNAIEITDHRTIKVKEKYASVILLYSLGKFADLVDYNPVKRSAIFRLSAEAGRRAQAQGLVYESVEYFLAHSLSNRKQGNMVYHATLPPRFIITLKAAMGYYSPAKAERAITIKVTQSQQLDEIFSLDEFKPALIERATPHTALVRESEFAKLREGLKELGVAIFAPEFDPALPEPAPVVVETVIEEEESEETPAKGKRARKAAKPAAPKAARPKISEAERQRTQRETTEANFAKNGLGGLSPYGISGGFNIPQRGQPLMLPPEIEQNIIQAMSKQFFSLNPDDLDFEDDFPPPPRRRR